jgi:hypothetical protein
MNDQAHLISKCNIKKCFFFHYRMGKNNSNPRISALKQIRKFCLDCGEGWKGVKECIHSDCSLHIFRFGKNPFSQRKGNPDALKKARESRTR